MMRGDGISPSRKRSSLDGREEAERRDGHTKMERSVVEGANRSRDRDRMFGPRHRGLGQCVDANSTPTDSCRESEIAIGSRARARRLPKDRRLHTYKYEPDRKSTRMNSSHMSIS